MAMAKFSAIPMAGKTLGFSVFCADLAAIWREVRFAGLRANATQSDRRDAEQFGQVSKV